MTRSLWLPIAMLVMSAPAHAQSMMHLSGMVVDGSGNPIPLVTVSLSGFGTNSTTATGAFLFDVPVSKVGTSVTFQAVKTGWNEVVPPSWTGLRLS